MTYIQQLITMNPVLSLRIYRGYRRRWCITLNLLGFRLHAYRPTKGDF